MPSSRCLLIAVVTLCATATVSPTPLIAPPVAAWLHRDARELAVVILGPQTVAARDFTDRLVTSLHTKPELPVHVTQGTRPATGEPPQSYVIVAQRQMDLVNYVRSIYDYLKGVRATDFNPQAKILIVFLQIEIERKECFFDYQNLYSNLIYVIWMDGGILNLVLMEKWLLACEEDGDDRYFIFNPFVNSNNTWRGKLDVIPDKDMLILPDIFKKRLHNMNRYDVKVNYKSDLNTYYIRLNGKLKLGRDFNLLIAMANAMQFKIQLRTVKEDACKQGLRDLLHGKTDFLINVCSILPSHIQTVTYLPPVDYTKLRVLAPKGGFVSPLTILFRCFSWQVWVTTLAVYVACSVAWHGIATALGPRRQRWDASFVQILHAFVAVSCQGLQRARAHSQRLLMSWCLLGSGVVLVSSLQGVLFQLMAQPRRHPDIDTLHRLDESGLPVRGLSYGDMIAFEGVDSSAWKNLNARIKGTNGTAEEELEAVASRRDRAVLTNPDLVKMTRSLSPHLFEEIHVVDEHAKIIYFAYCVTRSSPYASQFQRAVLAAVESGLLTHWDEYGIQEYVRKKAKSVRKVGIKSGGKRAFSLIDLVIAFTVLLAGLLCSAVVFGTELRLCVNRHARVKR